MKTTMSPIDGAIADLEAGQYVKCIIGASKTDASQIRLLAGIYTYAGVSAIDVNAEPASINAALAGREIALAAMAEGDHETAVPLVLASVVHRQDVHGLKARIDSSKCVQCGACRHECHDDAITPDFRVETARCRGCGWCREVCPRGAAELYCPVNRPPMHMAAELALRAGADAVEFHMSGLPHRTVATEFAACAPIVGNRLTSVCLYSNQTSPCEAGRQVRMASEAFPGPLIIQADGAPMSGGKGDAAGLQAIAAGHLALEAIQRKGVYIQISGGVVEATMGVARMLGVQLSGCGLGKWALQAVQPEFSQLMERADPLGDPADATFVRAVDKARGLVSRLRAADGLTPVEDPDGSTRHFVGPSTLFVNT